MSRGFKITRSEYFEIAPGDRVDWIDELADKIEKASQSKPITAVEVARSRNQSILDQINSIVNRSGTNSVDKVVDRYQEETGLKSYLKSLSAKEETNKKTAQEVHDLPDNFNKFPKNVQEDIKSFIRNIINNHHGNIHVTAVIEDVLNLFKQKGLLPQDANDNRFEKYISDEILESKKNNPERQEHLQDLGRGVGLDSKDMDNVNDDMFSRFMPKR